jgi:hypothetical protein
MTSSGNALVYPRTPRGTRAGLTRHYYCKVMISQYIQIGASILFGPILPATYTLAGKRFQTQVNSIAPSFPDIARISTESSLSFGASVLHACLIRGIQHPTGIEMMLMTGVLRLENAIYYFLIFSLHMPTIRHKPLNLLCTGLVSLLLVVVNLRSIDQRPGKSKVSSLPAKIGAMDKPQLC